MPNSGLPPPQTPPQGARLRTHSSVPFPRGQAGPGEAASSAEGKGRRKTELTELTGAASCWPSQASEPGALPAGDSGQSYLWPLPSPHPGLGLSFPRPSSEGPGRAPCSPCVE